MSGAKRNNPFKSIIKGYFGIIIKIGYSIFTLFIIATVCSVIILPFWYLATRNRILFNYTFLILLTGGIVSLLILRIRNSKTTLSSLLFAYVKKTLKYILAIFILYFILLLYLSGKYILGIFTSFIVLILFGYFKYAYPVNKKEKENKNVIQNTPTKS